MICRKAVKMAQMMNIPVFGHCRNMSIFKCRTAEEKHVFGDSHIDTIASQFDIDTSPKAADRSNELLPKLPTRHD